MKKITCALMTLILVVSLAACAGPGAGTGGAAVTPATPATPAAPAQGEAQQAAPPVEMSLMGQGGAMNEIFINILNEYIETFNAENEFNVRFTSEFFENEQYRTRIATMMAANNQPDVFFTWEAAFIQPFVEGGNVFPIGSVMDDEWRDRFIDGVLPLHTFDGMLYAVPNILNFCVVFYNTRLFEEHGVSTPNTFEELLEIVEVFYSAGITPITFGTRDAWVSGQYIQAFANATAGIGLFDDLMAGETTWYDPRFIEAGLNAQRLIDANAFAPGFLGRSGDEAIENFMAENSAMFYHMVSNLARLTSEGSDVADNLGFFMFPTVGGVHDPNVVVGSIAQSFAVSSRAENIDGAVAFLRGMSDESLHQRIAYEWSNIPTTRIQLDYGQLNPHFAQILELRNGITRMTPWFDRMFGGGVGPAFNNASVSIMSGDDVETAFRELERFTIDTLGR